MSDTIVTIPEEETIKSGTVIHLPVEELGDEVLYKGHFKTVKIDRYWDSHGRKIYDEEEWPCQVLKDVDVEIINHKQMCYGDRWDWWELKINDEKWGTIEGYLARKTIIHIDAPTGHG